MMNSEQQEQIVKMRLQGMGYKSIALKLGISRDTVRYICRKNNIMGNVTAAKLNYSEIKSSGNVCKNCGAVIEQTGHGRKKSFCSDRCRSQWWNKNYMCHNFGNAAMHEIYCKYCGRRFISYSKKDRKYCSHECYICDRFGGDRHD